MAMNWDDIRLFLSVARAESLTRAGQHLRLDPATLSRRIARLEDSLAVRLFVKSPQGYRLTEAGQDLFDQVSPTEDAMRSAEAHLSSHAAHPKRDRSEPLLRGPIRLGAPDGCANYLLPQVCTALARDHPELDIQIVALPRVFNLSQREADMAIAVSAPTAGRLVVQKITDYALHLAASNTYLARTGPIRDAGDLRDKTVVGYIPDMIFDQELDYLSDLGLSRVPLASNSVAVQLNLIRQGAGVGVVHDFALPFAPGVQRVLADQIGQGTGCRIAWPCSMVLLQVPSVPCTGAATS